MWVAYITYKIGFWLAWGPFEGRGSVGGKGHLGPKQMLIIAKAPYTFHPHPKSEKTAPQDTGVDIREVKNK